MSVLDDRLKSFAAAIKTKLDALQARLVPAGGSSGQVLAKASSTNFDLTWATPSAGGGSSAPVIVTTATNYAETATSGEKVIECTAALTVTLPNAIGNTAKLNIKSKTTGTITVATTASQTIDGATTASITAQYATLSVISDNANWAII